MGYRNMFNKVESILLKVCIISLLFLIGLQVIVSHDDLTVFTGENGTAKSGNNSIYNEKGVIILSLEEKDYKDVEVLVNGEVITNFNDKDEVTINVFNNDLVEINGTKYLDKIKVKVVGVSKNIRTPKLNTLVETSKNIELLGKVILN